MVLDTDFKIGWMNIFMIIYKIRRKIEIIVKIQMELLEQKHTECTIYKLNKRLDTTEKRV